MSLGAERFTAKEVSGGPYRVMICDDSAVVRGLIARELEVHDDIRIIVTASNGQQAIDAIRRFPIEVCILDVEMPIMDGMTALPQLIELRPDMQIIVASTLTLRNADISLRALASGAADYVTKPSTFNSGVGLEGFRIEIISKVKALAAARRRITKEVFPTRRRDSHEVFPVASPKQEFPRDAAQPIVKPAESIERALSAPRRRAADFVGESIVLKAPSKVPPAAIAIGSSTGGPQALFKLLGDLKGTVNVPIFITQHMPPTFTTILAEHITRITGIPAIEALDGTEITDGRVYVAPGDYHLVIKRHGSKLFAHATKEPPQNFCRPSIDPMVRSLSQIFGPELLTIILTGMGSDGLHGCREAAAAGGTILAQDEASSVVWGMPQVVARAGICSAILPLNDIAHETRRLMTRNAA